MVSFLYRVQNYQHITEGHRQDGDGGPRVQATPKRIVLRANKCLDVANIKRVFNGPV